MPTAEQKQLRRLKFLALDYIAIAQSSASIAEEARRFVASVKDESREATPEEEARAAELIAKLNQHTERFRRLTRIAKAATRA